MELGIGWRRRERELEGDDVAYEFGYAKVGGGGKVITCMEVENYGRSPRNIIKLRAKGR